jgi:adenylate cyclase
MGKEIERKYLLKSEAWRDLAHSKTKIRQGYLSTDEARSVRIRTEDDRAFLTIKGIQKGTERAEYEYPIPLEDAHRLLESICLKPLILKTRYKIQAGRLTWEIDEFAGKNNPLVVAEVETRSKKPPARKPDWIGEEVSSDSRYLNINLVKHPYSSWTATLFRKKTKFYLKRTESIPQGLKRIVSEEFAAIIEQLKQYEHSLDESVHNARKSIKKLRAIVRLMSPLGDSNFLQENDTLRDISRKLSEIRDAQAILEAFDDLIADYSSELNGSMLENIRQALIAQKTGRKNDFDSDQIIPKLIKELQDIYGRADDWPYSMASANLLAKGLEKSFRRGRHQFYEIKDSNNAVILHEWRKRTKDLRYQLNLLQQLWPDVFKGYLKSIKKLEQLLGQDHNLVVLHDLTREMANLTDFSQDSRQLLPIIALEQRALRKKAKRLGERIYNEKPKQWKQRIIHSWNAWKKGGK